MRKHWLDNLRWATVVLVLIYHVFYFFNNKGVFGGIGGFCDNPKAQPQDIIEYILYPWFMLLLFLVAGISARYSLDRHGAKEFRRSRAAKLLVPSTIGLFVFQWITGYFNSLAADLGQVPGIAKYILYTISGIGPLWFIQDLFVFSLLLLAVRRIDRNDKLWNSCSRIQIPGIILLGIIVFLAAQVIIRSPRPESADGLVNLYRPVPYFTIFLLGYFVFSHDGVQEKLAGIWMWLMPGALLAGGALILRGWGNDYTAPAYMTSWLHTLYAWLMILALIGLFKAKLDRTSAFADYMTRSSFGLYVVHYAVVAGIGSSVYRVEAIPVFAKYAILLVSTFVLSFVLWEVLRHIPVIRWCVFGIKKRAAGN